MAMRMLASPVVTFQAWGLNLVVMPLRVIRIVWDPNPEA